MMKNLKKIYFLTSTGRETREINLLHHTNRYLAKIIINYSQEKCHKELLTIIFLKCNAI